MKKPIMDWNRTEAGLILKGAPPEITNGLRRDFEDSKLKGTRKELDEIVAGERKAYFYGPMKISKLKEWLRLFDQPQELMMLLSM